MPELLDLLVLGIGIAFWPRRRGQEVPELLDLLVFSLRDSHRVGARARVKRCAGTARPARVRDRDRVRVRARAKRCLCTARPARVRVRVRVRARAKRCVHCSSCMTPPHGTSHMARAPRYTYMNKPRGARTKVHDVHVPHMHMCRMVRSYTARAERLPWAPDEA